MKLFGKIVELGQLRTEAVAAGYSVPALGQSGDVLHTYDGAGSIIDVPPGMQAVVDAHVPAPLPSPVNYGTDDTPREQVADAVTSLRNYLSLATPTNAQTIAVIKLIIRVLLFTLKTIRV